MLDVTKKIANLLEGIAHIELAGSEAELKMPSIYIEQVSNYAPVTFDKRDFLTEFIYQLDVYAEEPEICIAIAEEIDVQMQADGWNRTNAALMGRQRYMLTYKALVSEKFNTYKE